MRAVFDRVTSSYNRDSDIFLLGLGYRWPREVSDRRKTISNDKSVFLNSSGKFFGLIALVTGGRRGPFARSRPRATSPTGGRAPIVPGFSQIYVEKRRVHRHGLNTTPAALKIILALRGPSPIGARPLAEKKFH